MKLSSLLILGLASLGATVVSQAQTPSTYYFGRIGLFNDPVYVNPGNPPGSSYTNSSTFSHFTDSCYAIGSSQRFDVYTFGLPGGTDLWATNTITGITKEIGLYTPGTPREATVQGVTEGGIVFGQANLYVAGSSFPAPFAIASWVADAESGITVRTGLFGPEFIGSFGFGSSQTLGATENGMVFGSSLRFGDGYSGFGTWITNTDNGVTSRVGFFTSDYTSAGTQNSTITSASNLNFVTGNSDRFINNVPMGQTGWVATTITGGTYPVGLYQPPLYVRTDGYAHTHASIITHSGYVIGDSARFNGSTDIGRAAWIHNLNTNTPKRVGLTTAEFTDSTTGTQISRATNVSETGHVGGFSKRFSGSTDLGQAAWIVNFADGIAVRAGLTGAEFTKSDGYQSSGLHSSQDPTLFPLATTNLPPQGNGYGFSLRYINDELKGNAAWVFNKSTGVTTRVGYYTTPEYIDTDGTVVSYFDSERPASDTGWVIGGSYIYTPSGDLLGSTLWAASTITGVTIPTGFYSTDYTAANGNKVSTVQGFHHGGHVFGTSWRYISGAFSGQAAWAVNLNTTGTTVRIGLFGTPEFVLASGSEYTLIQGSTESGYIWGYSSRAEASGGGQVAWVYNLITGIQQTFKVQVAPDGKSNTQIFGVTENGLVYGNYAAYDPATSAPLGLKNFVWSPAKGIVVLENQIGATLTANNWTSITAFKLNRHGVIVAQGQRGINTQANPGGTGVFRAYFAQ